MFWFRVKLVQFFFYINSASSYHSSKIFKPWDQRTLPSPSVASLALMKKEQDSLATDRNPDTQNELDPIFQETVLAEKLSSKRAVWDLYSMVKCGTGCDPLVYKGYGCYCGFLGSGPIVDGIDRCCKMHDWCYSTFTTSCKLLEYNLPYFVPYKWKCNGGSPYCISGTKPNSAHSTCSNQLCECDVQFVNCLRQFHCPKKKAMCRSPWRYFQNLFMGLGTGMGMKDMEYKSIHHQRPR